MINKTILAAIAVAATVGIASPASAEFLETGTAVNNSEGGFYLVVMAGRLRAASRFLSITGRSTSAVSRCRKAVRRKGGRARPVLFSHLWSKISVRDITS